jgi:hypothetical protein
MVAPNAPFGRAGIVVAVAAVAVLLTGGLYFFRRVNAPSPTWSDDDRAPAGVVSIDDTIIRVDRLGNGDRARPGPRRCVRT